MILPSGFLHAIMSPIDLFDMLNNACLVDCELLNALCVPALAA